MSNELTISKANSFVEASYSMTLDEMRVLSLTLGVFDQLILNVALILLSLNFVNIFLK